MRWPSVLFFMLILATFSVFAQTGYDKRAMVVMKANRPQRKYVFANKDGSIVYLTYLGQLHSRKNEIFKVVNSTWIWGLSHRATSRILIFDHRGKYLGNYYLTTMDDLPTNVSGSRLIFRNRKASDCDVKVISAVDFANGIPKEFFRNCKDNTGDIYCFDKDD